MPLQTLTCCALAAVILVMCSEPATGSPSSFSPSSSSSSSSLLGHLDSRSKRMVTKRFHGSSCQGFFTDKGLYNKLDKEVCEDCQNILYHHLPDVKKECRRDCFVNDYFEQCVYRLMLDAELYLAIREGIAGS